MKDWRRHFRVEPTLHDLYRMRLSDGVGHSQAYRDVYGPLPDVEPKEWAKQLRAEGKSIRFISLLMRLRFGFGCPSVIHRFVNDEAYQAHLAQKRKS